MVKATTKTKVKTTRKRPTKIIKDKLADDNIFIFKLVLYLILGAQWVRITNGSINIPIPIGAVIGIMLVRKEHLSIDRKIGYAILLISMFIAFWLPLGIVISL